VSTHFCVNPASPVPKYRWTWRAARATDRQSDTRFRKSAARVRRTRGLENGVACVANVSRGYVLLKAAIDELARRFATTSGGGTGRQRLRERTDDLVLDLLAALRTASLSEIAEATRALERRRKTRSSARATTHETATSALGGARRGEAFESDEVSRTLEDRSASAARDPFDITVPSDLLEPPASAPFRAPRRTSRRQPSDLAGLSAAAPSVQEPPPPTVSLREGEQLLRSGGAGAIIRRVRGS
jgi:hypothetical protein